MAANESHLNRIVGFTEMQHGTREDYQLLERYEREYVSELPGRILAALGQLSGSLGGYPVTRLEHSLQAATRARRDGADDELVVAALIHDVGDELAPFNHAEIACAIIRPYVRPQVTWIVEQHGLFQSFYYAHHLGANRDGRERFRDHPWYQACKASARRAPILKCGLPHGQRLGSAATAALPAQAPVVIKACTTTTMKSARAPT